MPASLSLGPLDPRGGVAAALLSPSLLLVVMLLAVPLLLLGRYSLNQFIPGQFMVEGLTFDNFRKFVEDEYYRQVLWRTVSISLASTAICLLLGLAPAYYIARMESARWKAILIICVILPLLMGNAVRVAGWMVLLGDRGIVNAFLQFFGLSDAPVQLLYTGKAVLIGIVSVNLPFMIITLQSVIEGIARPLEEAGLGLGASPMQVFLRILLPLMMPGVAAGTILCFILSMNAYATPLLIGGPSFQMMAPAVYEQITKANNWPFGAALAFVLMVSTLVLTVLSSWVLSRYTPRAARSGE